MCFELIHHAEKIAMNKSNMLYIFDYINQDFAAPVDSQIPLANLILNTRQVIYSNSGGISYLLSIV